MGIQLTKSPDSENRAWKQRGKKILFLQCQKYMKKLQDIGLGEVYNVMYTYYILLLNYALPCTINVVCYAEPV